VVVVTAVGVVTVAEGAAVVDHRLALMTITVVALMHDRPARSAERWDIPPFVAGTETTTATTLIDPNWYVDTGATDHITSDLDRLALRERYHGGEQVQVGNGAGLQILHTGHSTINSDHRPLALRNILHVPDISKIFFPSKNFHVKTMCFLNSIRPIFQLRIVGQGEDSWKGGVKAGSTQSHFLINRSSSMHS
jgi:hypothetical protein